MIFMDYTWLLLGFFIFCSTKNKLMFKYVLLRTNLLFRLIDCCKVLPDQQCHFRLSAKIIYVPFSSENSWFSDFKINVEVNHNHWNSILDLFWPHCDSTYLYFRNLPWIGRKSYCMMPIIWKLATVLDFTLYNIHQVYKIMWFPILYTKVCLTKSANNCKL